jgi:hypothetical protein
MNIKGRLAKIEEISIPPRRTHLVLRNPLQAFEGSRGGGELKATDPDACVLEVHCKWYVDEKSPA